MKSVFPGVVAILFTVLTACSPPADAPPTDATVPAAATIPAPATGERGMVSSAHPLATEAGVAILEAGGNAYDAAVAVAAALNVVEPMMSGIGGYGTILIYDAETRTSRFLNSSGRIPM